MVLEAEGKRLALVTLDLGRVFGPASLAGLRERLAKTSGISLLLITASHTHSGPNILDEYPSHRPPSWEAADLDKIAGAVAEACAHLTEARLGTGYGRAYIGYNRRRVFPDGTVSMFWTNPDKVPTSPVDPTVSVLRIDTAAGKPLAVLVNYACHPVVFGPDNLQYSADYVGVMARTVEEAVGGSPLCLFLQGGDGDINPYYATTPLADGAVKKRDWTGEQLGAEAARVAMTINTLAASAAPPAIYRGHHDFRRPLGCAEIPPRDAGSLRAEGLRGPRRPSRQRQSAARTVRAGDYGPDQPDDCPGGLAGRAFCRLPNRLARAAARSATRSSWATPTATWTISPPFGPPRREATAALTPTPTLPSGQASAWSTRP